MRYLMFFIAVVLFSADLSGQISGVVCRTNCIEGYSYLCRRGTNWVKENTTEISQMKIYVDVAESDGSTLLFVHSNYKTFGADYPTKILYNIDESGLEIDTYIINIISEYSVSDELKRAIREDIQFYVSNRVYRNENTRKLNLNGATNVKVLTNNQTVIPNGYNHVELQRAVLDKGYDITVDGYFGNNSKALLKKANRLPESAKIDVTDEGLVKVKFNKADDFLKYQKKDLENSCEGDSVCVDSNGKISMAVECGLFSIEATTEGEITMTVSESNKSYSLKINQAEPDNNDGCNIGLDICMGKNVVKDGSINCGDGSIQISSAGTIKLASESVSVSF